MTAPMLHMRRPATGYVPTAPACGDCKYASAQPVTSDTVYCKAVGDDVADGGRCLYWQPSEEWLAANPTVAAAYGVLGLMPGKQGRIRLRGGV